MGLFFNEGIESLREKVLRDKYTAAVISQGMGVRVEHRY